MPTKHSKAELIRLLEAGIREEGNLDPAHFFVLVRDVIASGSPPEKIIGYVVLRFLPAGSPFCCGEPLCHLNLLGSEGQGRLGEWLQREMGITQCIDVELKIKPEYGSGVEFKSFN